MVVSRHERIRRVRILRQHIRPDMRMVLGLPERKSVSMDISAVRAAMDQGSAAVVDGLTTQARRLDHMDSADAVDVLGKAVINSSVSRSEVALSLAALAVHVARRASLGNETTPRSVLKEANPPMTDIGEPRGGGKTNLMPELIAAAEQARRRNVADIPVIYVLVSFLYFILGGIRSLITVAAVAVAGAWAGAHVFAGTALDVADGPVLGKLGISVAQLVGAAVLSLIWIALDVLMEGFIEPLVRSLRFRGLRRTRRLGVRLDRVMTPARVNDRAPRRTDQHEGTPPR